MSDFMQQKHCVPCEEGTPPMAAADIAKHQAQIHPVWQLIDGKKLRREWTFKNFVAAMAFINRVAEIAEREGHHPDMYIFYNCVKLDLWTHAARGLTENDFIMAAKIEKNEAKNKVVASPPKKSVS